MYHTDKVVDIESEYKPNEFLDDNTGIRVNEITAELDKFIEMINKFTYTI